MWPFLVFSKLRLKRSWYHEGLRDDGLDPHAKMFYKCFHLELSSGLRSSAGGKLCGFFFCIFQYKVPLCEFFFKKQRLLLRGFTAAAVNGFGWLANWYLIHNSCRIFYSFGALPSGILTAFISIEKNVEVSQQTLCICSLANGTASSQFIQWRRLFHRLPSHNRPPAAAVSWSSERSSRRRGCCNTFW